MGNEFMMDLYELTMANGYFREPDALNTRVMFDVFYRKNPDDGGYAIFAGLQQVLDYLRTLHFTQEDIDYLAGLHMFDDDFLEYLRTFVFTGNVIAMPEGTIVYPNEPLLTIEGNLVEAQLVETAILAQINHQSLIATKASRIVRAAAGRPVSDFGARRAHNNDAAIYGARACYIGGVKGTATVAAGQAFDIPVSGTMAHSWVMFYKNELEAFRKFAKIYPDNCILLVDTYDVLKQGVPNAIKVFKEMRDQGIHSKNYGIRIDSGDLAYLSRMARQLLDEAGFQEAKIIVSNSLDEYTIRSLIEQGAAIDGFGVGERMITAKSEPVFGAVYKLAGVQNEDGTWEPRIKVSASVEKITNPGVKYVVRAFDRTSGHAVADIIAGEEWFDYDTENPIEVIDPNQPWKKVVLENCYFINMRQLMMENGDVVTPIYTVKELAEYVRDQLTEEVWEEEQRFENPHVHYIDMTPEYYNMKLRLLDEVQNGNG